MEQPRWAKFPRSVKHVVEYIQPKGLQLGLYMAAGNETCNDGGRPYKIPGSYLKYEEDAATIVSWGVTYVKLE